MVSSKCCQVVSPSPFRFLAALIPPCAHTECDRFTGTIEKRSTLPPASAILMTAASPASPPPTTMILGADAISLFLPWALRRRGFDPWLLPFIPPLGTEEGCHRRHANGDQSERNHNANSAKPLAGSLTHGDAPFCAEQIQTIREMP